MFTTISRTARPTVALALKPGPKQPLPPCSPIFSAYGPFTITSGATPRIVNGPYAQKIGLHGGNGCFGPGFRANASIGRAIRLMLLNLGGGISGRASATVFSSPIRYTACLTWDGASSPWALIAVSGCQFLQD